MKTATSPSNLHSRCGGRLARFVALALAALVGFGVASAQTASPASRPATPMAGARAQTTTVPARHSEEEETEAKPNDVSHQGIKIHGHWKIDIKNSDGSLASTHEFENSLYDGGSLFSYLLTSRATSGEAAIFLTTLAGSNCSNSGCVEANYLMSETSTGYWVSVYCSQVVNVVCVPNLNVAVAVQTGTYNIPNGAKVVLSGSVVANASVSIYQVGTSFASCSSATGLATVTPAQCHSGTVPDGTNVNLLPQNAGASGILTEANLLNSNISALSGQTIQVTVTLSFS